MRFGKRDDDARTVRSALTAVGAGTAAGATGFFGEPTRAACARWQRMPGPRDSDADGLPGRSSPAGRGAGAGFAVDRRRPAALAKSSVRFSTNTGVAVGEITARGFAEQACDLTGAPRSRATGVDGGANLPALVSRESSHNPNAVNPPT
ncbi:hypothetical protein [Streptomyces sp. NPDC003401]